ncbi:tetratricopeptide repeat protein [Commensalibacter oyaizuii]|uniref:Tetratricopeptide repeat protein n=1 Tax=Commensalibacter oyaizuii TaxID=3043873 RepID=A0ABT6Q3P4_9PROT|nr:tetratricopeptide repeat protein [Commensalibacter sp. TBRC 16381]MDI2091741.1 tetratricopeptide repeat protein [Commensalibacter sp. TBRC 16381]
MLLKVAQQGNVEDQYKLALFYSENQDAKMQSKAELWMIKVADQGLPAAQIDLGQWYLKGTNGVKKNYNKAKAIFQKLADQGNAEGLYYLGLCYRLGYGVTKDFRKAVELNEAAADKGDTKSAIYLTTVYLLGIDDVVSQDRNRFEYYYNQVCSKDKFECLKLHADIMDACGKKYSDNDFTNPDSNINPVCRAVALGMIKAISSLNGR